MAVIDCTGHGVPGAFVTMIAGAGFRSIISEEYFGNPAGMLQALNQFVTQTLCQELECAKSDNGMDMGFCCIDRKGGKITYAGAKFSLLIIDQNEIREIKGNKQSLGYKQPNVEYEFTNHSIGISSSAAYYLYSDGIVSQVGEKKKFPFGHNRFQKILRENCQKPFAEQKEILIKTFEKYQGNQKRRDDITVFGFSVMQTC